MEVGVEVGAEVGVEVGVGGEVEVGWVFWGVFPFFSLFPKTRRGSGGALGDGVTRVQVVTRHTRETRLPMNWIKGQNRDSGSAYGACAKSLVNKSINQSILLGTTIDVDRSDQLIAIGK